MRGAAPEVVTKNVAVWPTATVWLVGCVVIEGVTGTTALVNAKPHPDWPRAANNTVGRSRKIVR